MTAFDYARRDELCGGLYDLAQLGWSHLPVEVKRKINVAQMFCEWAAFYGEPLSPDNLKNRCYQQRKREKSVSFLIKNVRTK